MTWIATLSNEFLGMVEEVDGFYVANDTAGGTYNTYRTLSEAMHAFDAHNVVPSDRDYKRAPSYARRSAI